jgi:hypothetical protein
MRAGEGVRTLGLVLGKETIPFRAETLVIASDERPSCNTLQHKIEREKGVISYVRSSIDGQFTFRYGHG